MFQWSVSFSSVKPADNRRTRHSLTADNTATATATVTSPPTHHDHWHWQHVRGEWAMFTMFTCLAEFQHVCVVSEQRSHALLRLNTCVWCVWWVSNVHMPCWDSTHVWWVSNVHNVHMPCWDSAPVRGERAMFTMFTCLAETAAMLVFTCNSSHLLYCYSLSLLPSSNSVSLSFTVYKPFLLCSAIIAQLTATATELWSTIKWHATAEHIIWFNSVWQHVENQSY